tara:strand:+ start:179 stop:427 length:249 start_codon:yes stop_codon:yes gene_type:complete
MKPLDIYKSMYEKTHNDFRACKVDLHVQVNKNKHLEQALAEHKAKLETSRSDTIDECVAKVLELTGDKYITNALLELQENTK